MANLNRIEKDKKNLIKNLKPYEMEAYIENLINNLYEAFLEQDKDKALLSKRLIEEATELYEAEGYDNSLAMELKLRLNKANEVLVNTLIEKNNAVIHLTNLLLDSKILMIIHSNAILESLIASYEKTPSEELASAIKEVAVIESNHLTGTKYLLECEKITENNVVAENVEILKDYYSTFEELLNKINSF